MKGIFFIPIILCIGARVTYSQSFTVRDMINLSALESGNVTNFMYKKGFSRAYLAPGNDSETSYIRKMKVIKKDTIPEETIDMFKKKNSKNIILKGLPLSQYLDSWGSLIKTGFVFDSGEDISKVPSMLFLKANISIELSREKKDTTEQYSISLKERKIPDSINYAEDLLQFDSHEFLMSYFGKKNVRNDLYYFSESDLKKCSVLFGGTDYQALFVWGNEHNFTDLSYIVISNVLPTSGNIRKGVPGANNEWKFRKGIHVGMPVGDLLSLNGQDFLIYGNKSNLSFMIKPEKGGKIDFTKTGIMFYCIYCYNNDIFDQEEVSAEKVAKENIPLRIFDVILYP
jgi:hypothetical protein